MNLCRSLVLVATTTSLLVSGAVAQSPSPSPNVSSPPGLASPSSSPAPTATPFRWLTIPRERLASGTFPEWPSGTPTARATDRGIRLELWLSSTTAAPGDWVQAIVRATNVGRDTAWVPTGNQCARGTQTRVDIDLRPVVPMGPRAAAWVDPWTGEVVATWSRQDMS